MSSTCDGPEHPAQPNHPSAVVSMYLSQHIPEYRELIELRKQVRTDPANLTTTQSSTYPQSANASVRAGTTQQQTTTFQESASKPTTPTPKAKTTSTA